MDLYQFIKYKIKKDSNGFESANPLESKGVTLNGNEFLEYIVILENTQFHNTHPELNCSDIDVVINNPSQIVFKKGSRTLSIDLNTEKPNKLCSDCYKINFIEDIKDSDNAIILDNNVKIKIRDQEILVLTSLANFDRDNGKSLEYLMASFIYDLALN